MQKIYIQKPTLEIYNRKLADDISIGGTLSETLSDCFMNKMEMDIVLSLKAKFYRRFVDETYRRKKKNQPDELSSKLNSCHPDINLTIGINPPQILDTKTALQKKEIRCFFYHNDNKLLLHWKSAVTRNSWNNVAVGDLYGANKISSYLKE